MDSSDEVATEGKLKLLSRTAGTYTIRTVTESTVTIDKNGVAISVSPDQVTKMPRMPRKAEPSRRYTTPQVSQTQIGEGQDNKATILRQTKSPIAHEVCYGLSR